ncbi:MAG: hypothetical protein WC774_02735, partial [Candidatus Gracilibacteria bacterium]
IFDAICTGDSHIDILQKFEVSKSDLPEVISAIKTRCITLLTKEKEKFVEEYGEYDSRAFRVAMNKKEEFKILINFFCEDEFGFDIFSHIPMSDKEFKNSMLFPSDNEISVNEVDFTGVK